MGKSTLTIKIDTGCKSMITALAEIDLRSIDQEIAYLIEKEISIRTIDKTLYWDSSNLLRSYEISAEVSAEVTE